MKIHTTQNLNDLTTSKSTNIFTSNSIRYPKKINNDKLNLERMHEKNDAIMFKGREARIIKFVEKKAAEGIKGSNGNKPNSSFFAKVKKALSKWLDKTLNSPNFDKVLDLMGHEVLVQAAISCLICVILRPLTIIAMADKKKDKSDNLYAASHSMASGVVGLVASLIITTPFSKGIKYAGDPKRLMNLSEDILAKMFPHLDLKSIWKNKAKGLRKPMNEWLDLQGNTFSKEIKNVLKVARPKHISEVSEETLKSIGVNVDLASQKGKKFSEMVDRNGKKLRLETKDMFIQVAESGMGKKGKEAKNYFSLEHIDENFLADIFKDLNIETIKKDGKRLHPENWKNKDGSRFMPDLLDHIHISSYRETADAIPLYTGRTRIDTLDKGVVKYKSYQSNNGITDTSRVPDKLGSEINQEYLNADYVNDVKNKMLGWMPDIVTRPLVASTTIVLLPWILKNVFHLEKNKKPAEKVEQQVLNNSVETVKAEKTVEAKVVKTKEVETQTSTTSAPAFKGGKPNKGLFDKIGEAISKFFSKHYAEPMNNKMWLQNLSEKMSKAPGSMTEHMATLGSLITSSVYVTRTLKNKELDSDKRRTLAINQTLCFIVPTICAYTVNNWIGGLVKKLEYRYSGLKEQEKALGKITAEKAEEMAKKLGGRLKGVKALGTLFTFTLIYRYLTPVLITPGANKIGEKINQKRRLKEAEEAKS